jgi:melanoma-associated antigen p97
MTSALAFVSLIVAFCPLVYSDLTLIRLCVPLNSREECVELSKSTNGLLNCVVAKDRYECLNFVSSNKADVFNVDPSELYIAGKIYNLVPFAMEEFMNRPYRYKAVALVRRDRGPKSGDLRGVKSCHTGIYRNAGYSIPTGFILEKTKPAPDCRGELYSVEKYFGESCIPGKYSPDPKIDIQLKRRHPNLCKLCKNPSTCSSSDEYAGYTGAIKCLVDGRGDVAFTKADAVDGYFQDKSDQLNDYEYLCPNGTRTKIENIPECYLAKRPTNTYVTRKNNVNLVDNYYELLKRIYKQHSSNSYYRSNKVFDSFYNVPNILKLPVEYQGYEQFLDKYLASIERPLQGCGDSNDIKLCTTSSEEYTKCMNLKRVLFAYKIRPELKCIQKSSKSFCLDALKSNEVDIVSLDLQSFVKFGSSKNLQALAASYDKCDLVSKEPKSFAVTLKSVSRNVYYDYVQFLISVNELLTKKLPSTLRLYNEFDPSGDLIFADIYSSLVSISPNSTSVDALVNYRPAPKYEDTKICSDQVSFTMSNFAKMAIIGFRTLFF